MALNRAVDAVEGLMCLSGSACPDSIAKPSISLLGLRVCVRPRRERSAAQADGLRRRECAARGRDQHSSRYCTFAGGHAPTASTLNGSLYKKNITNCF